ncbi:hypothetical protein PENSPDRAFT_650757 [Peniophora sp. CONT]|nr:hypothetical protein PENSPDRAFT_650757 [Peniophora sp. CONT]
MSELLFQDNTGQQVKFFIQRDVPDYARICADITALGGRVEDKIPRSGFVLIAPGSEEGNRLIECWNKPEERPDRFFVPFTYVQACRAEGRLLRQIFLVAHRRLKFYIHPDIANVHTRDIIRSQIIHSGGDPDAGELETDVIIADHGNPEVFNHLVKVNNGFQNHVETFQWIKKCIDTGEVDFTPLVYKNPGGRRAGEERTPFTTEDEHHLCQWIAEKIPYKTTGGRTGNKLYQQLVDKADEPGFAWVKRHTWQSWRERYKKNPDKMDPLIARIVDERKPAIGEVGQYGFSRKAEPAPRKRSGGKRKASTPLEGGEGATDAERIAAALAGHMPLPPGMPPPFPPGYMPGQMPPPPFAFHPPPHMPPPPPPEGIPGMGGGPMDHIPPPSQPLSQPEAGPSGEGESQWPIREGSGPQPGWAKRKAEDDEEGGAEPKRQRVDEQTGDPAITEIAEECRFTVKEVQEYFDKKASGDLEKTRKRFKKMREHLDSLKLEDDD